MASALERMICCPHTLHLTTMTRAASPVDALSVQKTSPRPCAAMTSATLQKTVVVLRRGSGPHLNDVGVWLGLIDRHLVVTHDAIPHASLPSRGHE
jgi:hypothetical protein